jgi:Ribonuclease G/E
MVEVHPGVANLLCDEERHLLENLERRYQVRITVHASQHLYLEQYEICALA